MPHLKRVLSPQTVAALEADGVSLDTTAEQLLSESIHSQTLPQARKLAAANCAATPIHMSALLDDTSGVSCDGCSVLYIRSSESWSSGEGVGGSRHSGMSTLEANATAVCAPGMCGVCLVSSIGEQTSVVARVEPHARVKAARRCASKTSDQYNEAFLSDAFYKPLQHITFKPCRDVYRALCELEEAQRMWSDERDGYRFVAVAPFCELLGPFVTAPGLSATGEGMRRMLQLAIKRLRATAPLRICVIQPVTAPPGSRRAYAAFRGKNDDDDDCLNDDGDTSFF
ncbi:hypothetical protein FI667_g11299, partial [Globisporangium splendens]